MKVIIFFTYGISLKDWEKSGLLDREVKLYKYLADKYDITFTFLTYGKSDDENILNYKNIQIIPIYKYIKKSNLEIFELIKSTTYPFRLRKIIDFENSILKTNQLWGAWLAVISKMLFKRPLIVRTGYDLVTFKIREKKSSFVIFLYKLLTKYSLKKSNYYIVTTDIDKKFLGNFSKKFNKKIKIIPNWIEVLEPKQVERMQKKIVSVGRLEKQKNYKDLITSFSNSEVEIDIYGSGSEKDNLISLAKINNVKVNFYGNIDNEKLLQILPKYKFFCTTTLYEGNPKSILEAMSAGCIVIAPKVKGVSNLIENNYNGLIYDPNCSDAYKVYEDNVNLDLSNISKNSVKYVKDFHHLEEIAKHELDLYKTLA